MKKYFKTVKKMEEQLKFCVEKLIIDILTLPLRAEDEVEEKITFEGGLNEFVDSRVKRLIDFFNEVDINQAKSYWLEHHYNLKSDTFEPIEYEEEEMEDVMERFLGDTSLFPTLGYLHGDSYDKVEKLFICRLCPDIKMVKRTVKRRK